MRTSYNRQGETDSVKKSSPAEKDPFPALYHAHHNDYVDDLPFWVELAKKQAGTILELGCGTGRVLLTLAQAGFRVYGIDKHPGMLDILKESLPASMMTEVSVYQADFSAFRLDQEFSLIILPCNTFSALDSNARIQTLKCVRQHLIPGGNFTFSVPNPALLARLDSNDEPEIETIFIHPSSGNPVQVSCDWHHGSDTLILNWHYDQLLPDGRVERLTTSIEHGLTSVEDYRQEMANAGFQIEAVYGDFDRSPYTAKSPNLIISAVLS